MLEPVAVAEVEGPRGRVAVGGSGGLVLIAGPCVIESAPHVLSMAGALAGVADRLGVPFIFKSSFDKANRTSLRSSGARPRRGPRHPPAGPGRGRRGGDHRRPPAGAAPAVAEVVDLLQIPAFLCRQTDLLVACAATGSRSTSRRAVPRPGQVGPAVAKLVASGARGVLVTERGASFGYHDLVVMRSLPLMRQLGVPVCFDATHSVQQPGGLGEASGGRRELVGPLARAAAGAGIDALFVEVHDAPERARSDAACQIRLSELEELLRPVLAIDVALSRPVIPDARASGRGARRARGG